MSGKKYDLVALGEVLIDFTFSGRNSEGKNIYEENPGGAPANCVGALCKLGGKGALIAMTGDDSFGDDIRKSLADINVDVSQIQHCDYQHTTLAFVTLDDDGERHFSFYRNPGADTQIDFSRIDKSYLSGTKILHVGSLSLAEEKSREATMKSIVAVKEANGLVSYDPNWRGPLWKSKVVGIEFIKSIFPLTDIVKISDEEYDLLFGSLPIEKGLADLHEKGVSLVLVTLGEKGVMYSFSSAGKTFSGTVPGKKVHAVDTTGAGDSFTGGLLYKLTRKENPLALEKEELEDYLAFANCVAAHCVTKKGAIPALPSMEDIKDDIKSLRH